MHPVDRLVGQRVQILRLLRGMSQSVLAAHLGVSFQQVQKYERGTNRMSASTLHRIAGLLCVSVADLFADAREPVVFTLARKKKLPVPSGIDLRILVALSRLPDPKVKQSFVELIHTLVGGRSALASLVSGDSSLHSSGLKEDQPA